MSVPTGAFASTPALASSSERELGLDAGELFAAIRRNKVTIFAWFCLCWAVAGTAIYVMPREYSAATMIMLETQRRQRGTAPSEGAQIALDSAQADSRMQVIKSERLLRYVFEALDLEKNEPREAPRFNPLTWLRQSIVHEEPISKEQLQTVALLKFMDRIAVRRLGLSYVIEIAVRAKSPAAAVHLANSVTMAYVRDTLSVNLREGELLQRRVADVAQEDKILVEGVKTGVVPTAQFPDAEARIIAAAVEPFKPSSPQVGLILLAATVFAALTSLCAVFFQRGGDQSIDRPRQIRRRFDRGLLARIPRSRKRSTRRGELDEGQVLAFHAALKPFLASSRSKANPVVALVNCEGGGGLGTIATGLAMALRQSGHTPTLIDADKDLTSRFGMQGYRGLQQTLEAQNPTSNVIFGRSVAECPFIPSGLPLEGSRLRIENAKMRDLLGLLEEKGPVLLCLPPLTRSADALHLGAFVDGFVIVVQAGRTTVSSLRSTIDGLRDWDTNILGIVMSHVETTDSPKASRREREAHRKTIESTSEVRA